MIHIKLAGGKSAIVDEEFAYLAKYKWRLSKKGYVRRDIIKNGKRTTIDMHREIMEAKDGQIIDHINGNGLDNRTENLRFCTQAENNRNRKNTNPTGYKGISTIGSRFRARIEKDGKKMHIGMFDTLQQAAMAYNEKAKELFGEFAKLNII